ncbi:MAG TPA: 2'-5' RNA ligase family protein [Candidatus Saccharimonadales bacterium]|jgi:2'-5' RNA ligase
MVAVGSLIVVHFVEQQLEGWTFKRGHWPLHLTLVPWFQAADEEAVVRSLERVSSDLEPLLLAVGGKELFGKNRNVPVNVIKNQAPAQALHELLVATLSEADTSFDGDTFMGQKYRAHVPRHEGDNRYSSEGQDILVDDFHLVRLVDGETCRVEQQFDMRLQ